MKICIAIWKTVTFGGSVDQVGGGNEVLVGVGSSLQEGFQTDSLSGLVFEVDRPEVRVIDAHLADGLVEFAPVERVLGLCKGGGYVFGVGELGELDEELGDFSAFEDEDLDDEAKGRKTGKNGLIVDFEHNGVVDAHQEHSGGIFLGFGLSFLHIISKLIMKVSRRHSLIIVSPPSKDAPELL